MEKIRQVANACVGRAVMFGWLAIGLIMISFSFNPVMAFKSGAVLALVMSSILLVKAFGAARKHPKTTEVWVYLDDGSRPRNDAAREIFRDTMRQVYARYAQGVFVVGCVLFALSVVCLGLGFESTLPPQRLAVAG